jgi:hypothetical protein
VAVSVEMLVPAVDEPPAGGGVDPAWFEKRLQPASSTAAAASPPANRRFLGDLECIIVARL